MTVQDAYTATIADGDQLNDGYFNGVTSRFNGIVPIGTVLQWLKSYTNTPALDSKFVECNGQTLSDAESVYNGQVIPNLNGVAGGAAMSDGQKYQRFLRGSATSGTAGGSDTNDHTHTLPATSSHLVMGGNTSSNYYSPTTGSASNTENLPSYYEIVFIMRVK